MLPNTKVRLLGGFLFIVGVGLILYNWHSAVTRGVYWPKVSLIAPLFAFTGLSMIFYPISKTESLAKYGSEILPWKHVPRGQKILIILGVVVGVLQWAFFAGHLSI